jgi:hypothetical protein
LLYQKWLFKATEAVMEATRYLCGGACLLTSSLTVNTKFVKVKCLVWNLCTKMVSFCTMINQGQKPVHKLAIRDEVIDLEKGD